MEPNTLRPELFKSDKNWVRCVSFRMDTKKFTLWFFVSFEKSDLLYKMEHMEMSWTDFSNLKNTCREKSPI